MKPIEDVLYVLILTCRDQNELSRLHEVAIAMIEPDFSGFIFYEPIDEFIAGYGDGRGETSPVDEGMESLPLELNRNVKPFVGEETVDSDDEAEKPGAG